MRSIDPLDAMEVLETPRKVELMITACGFRSADRTALRWCDGASAQAGPLLTNSD